MWWVWEPLGLPQVYFWHAKGIVCTFMKRRPGRRFAGAAIGLQPIGMTVLAKLGILSPVLEHGRRIDAIKSVTERESPSSICGTTISSRGCLDWVYTAASCSKSCYQRPKQSQTSRSNAASMSLALTRSLVAVRP